jgi:hypothetical protein
MDHSGKDISVYYDSKDGIGQLYQDKPEKQEYKIDKVTPVKKPISEEILTQVMEEDPDKDEIFKKDVATSRMMLFKEQEEKNKQKKSLDFDNMETGEFEQVTENEAQNDDTESSNEADDKSDSE